MFMSERWKTKETSLKMLSRNDTYKLYKKRSINTQHACKLDHVFECLGLAQFVCINGEIMRQRKRASHKTCL